MGHSVKVYIYDISNGMARTMGPALIGRPIEAIWHTAIVVFNKEYFFGGDGISTCHPGGTQLGQPLKVEDLGETQITEGVFQEYLATQSRDRFRGDRYNLLQHNCNNFSHEVAQFLVGKGIPQHIIDLPREVMSTPMGRMFMEMAGGAVGGGGNSPFGGGGSNIPFTSGGSNIPFTNGGSSTPFSSGSSASASKTTIEKPTDKDLLPIKDFITFEPPLKIDGLTKKLEQFNAAQESETTRLTDSELKVVVGIAKGLVRLSDDNFAILTTKILQWQDGQVFPLLDILRDKAGKNSSFSSGSQVERVVDIFLQHLKDSSQEVNAMLSARGLCNLLSLSSKLNCPKIKEFPSLEAMIEGAAGQLPTRNPNLETAISSILSNISVLNCEMGNLEVAIMLSSNLASTILPSLTKDEAVYRVLVALGNLLSLKQSEVIDLLKSMEVKGIMEAQELTSHKEPKIAGISKQIIRMLSSTSNGIGGGLDLD